MTSLASVPFLRTGKDFAFIVAAFAGVAILLYVKGKAEAAGEAVGEVATKFYDGLTFDSDSLGPGVDDVLADGYYTSQEYYLEQGYIVNVNGTLKITPEGNKYIAEQQGVYRP